MIDDSFDKNSTNSDFLLKNWAASMIAQIEECGEPKELDYEIDRFNWRFIKFGISGLLAKISSIKD